MGVPHWFLKFLFVWWWWIVGLLIKKSFINHSTKSCMKTCVSEKKTKLINWSKNFKKFSKFNFGVQFHLLNYLWINILHKDLAHNKIRVLLWLSKNPNWNVQRQICPLWIGSSLLPVLSYLAVYIMLNHRDILIYLPTHVIPNPCIIILFNILRLFEKEEYFYDNSIVSVS